MTITYNTAIRKYRAGDTVYEASLDAYGNQVVDRMTVLEVLYLYGTVPGDWVLRAVGDRGDPMTIRGAETGGRVTRRKEHGPSKRVAGRHT